MSVEISFDGKMAEAVIEAQFKGTTITNFIQDYYYHIIDSKYRQSKRVDRFLAEQLRNPSDQLIRTAKILTDRKSPDKTIINILRFVKGEVDYLSDKKAYGKEEYWATALETLRKEEDDCDGINNLIYILARLAGIPEYVLYCMLCRAGGVGHLALLYWSSDYDKLVVIDGSFAYNKTSIQYRTAFKKQENIYNHIYYVFNDKIIFRPKR